MARRFICHCKWFVVISCIFWLHLHLLYVINLKVCAFCSLLTGCLILIHGKVVGRFRCRHYFLCGNLKCLAPVIVLVEAMNSTACCNLLACYLQVPVYIAEISPKNMRGVLGSINQVGFVLALHLYLVILSSKFYGF